MTWVLLGRKSDLCKVYPPGTGVNRDQVDYLYPVRPKENQAMNSRIGRSVLSFLAIASIAGIASAQSPAYRISIPSGWTGSDLNGVTTYRPSSGEQATIVMLPPSPTSGDRKRQFEEAASDAIRGFNLQGVVIDDPGRLAEVRGLQQWMRTGHSTLGAAPRSMIALGRWQNGAFGFAMIVSDPAAVGKMTEAMSALLTTWSITENAASVAVVRPMAGSDGPGAAHVPTAAQLTAAHPAIPPGLAGNYQGSSVRIVMSSLYSEGVRLGHGKASFVIGEDARYKYHEEYDGDTSEQCQRVIDHEGSMRWIWSSYRSVPDKAENTVEGWHDIEMAPTHYVANYSKMEGSRGRCDERTVTKAPRLRFTAWLNKKGELWVMEAERGGYIKLFAD